ncbi:MAG: hypothetical protein ABL915_05825 [Gallionella sp.]
MTNICDMHKKRELIFAAEPYGQVARAYALLNGLADCQVAKTAQPHTLLIQYSLEHFTLAGLERALIEQGFVLDNNLLHRITRQVIHYCEDTELHNMDVPEPVTKKREKEIFIQAYDARLHGDKDETTAPELRHYK